MAVSRSLTAEAAEWIERLREYDHAARRADVAIRPGALDDAADVLAALLARTDELTRALTDEKARSHFLDGMLRDAAEYLCEQEPHDALCGCDRPSSESTCLFSGWMDDDARAALAGSSPEEAHDA